MGVTARELAIIAAHEAGRAPADIAADLGVGVDYVRYRIQDLCMNLGANRAHERAMIDGSRTLLRAIEQARAA